MAPLQKATFLGVAIAIYFHYGERLSFNLFKK